MTKTVLWGQYSGIAKIVPPADWVHSVPPITKRSLADIRIKKPIQQNMIGGAGQFRQTNVEKLKNKPLTLQQWFDKSLHRNFAGPGPKDLDRTLDRDSEHARAQRAAEEEARKAKRQAKRAKKREIDRQRQERLESEAVKMEDTTIETRGDETAGDIAPLSSQAKDESSVAIEGLTNGDVEITDASEAVPALDPSSAASPQSSSEPLATTPQPESIPQWYESFEPTRDWLPQGTEVDDYTPEACATLERKFWKNIGLGEPSWYGADLQGESTCRAP